ncbi:MAG: hypothetical protein ACOCP4_05955 [Candidatus Woesearchaeota archaeon]
MKGRKFKKGDRVETVKEHKGAILYAQVIRGGKDHIDIIVDGSKQILQGPAIAFKISDKPVAKEDILTPEISFKKGDRVETVNEYKGEIVYGKVIKGGKKEITIVLDGGETTLSGDPALFKMSDKPMPEEPPNVMSKWGVKKYKEIDGHGDSPTFSAEITLNDKPVIHVSNDGWGGPNLYSNLHAKSKDYVKDFLNDAKEWWSKNSNRSAIECEDLWVDWYVNKKEFGVTSIDYIKNFNDKMEKFYDDEPQSSPVMK